MPVVLGLCAWSLPSMPWEGVAALPAICFLTKTPLPTPLRRSDLCPSSCSFPLFFCVVWLIVVFEEAMSSLSLNKDVFMDILSMKAGTILSYCLAIIYCCHQHDHSIINAKEEAQRHRIPPSQRGSGRRDPKICPYPRVQEHFRVCH